MESTGKDKNTFTKHDIIKDTSKLMTFQFSWFFEYSSFKNVPINERITDKIKSLDKSK